MRCCIDRNPARKPGWFGAVAVAMAMVLPGGSTSFGGDWPMWRYDSGHTAASPHDLPDSLHLTWIREESPRAPVWDDPLNQDMMPYDAIFEPVASEGKLFLGFNDTDKLIALDTRTGELVWSFYADGPVRFSPVAFAGKVYFVADDGCLYCVRASDGQLVWRFRGAPLPQKVIGNGRLISAWPARGGPVERDGVIYFATSIWPFMGTFIYAIDAETGDVRWINDSTSADFIKQPHGAPAFAGVAPQGQLAATAECLLAPGGRSLPACFDRKTGRQKYFDFGGKGQGGSFVAASESRYFVHTRRRATMAFTLADGRDDKWHLNEPVLAADDVYAANTPGDDDGQSAPGVIQAFDAGKRLVWQVEADGSGDLIRAGRRLYATGGGVLTAIELPSGDAPARVAWTQPIKGPVRRLLAGDGMLFAVTEDGRILAFSGEKGPVKSVRRQVHPNDLSPDDVARGARLVQQTGAHDGYALWFGADDLPLLEGVVAASELHVVVVDHDPKRVERLRRRFDEAGLYGDRVVVSEGQPADFFAPRYMASLIVVGPSLQGELPGLLPVLYKSLRPYGGKLWIPAGEVQAAALSKQAEGMELPRAKWTRTDGALIVGREGPLPGAAPWTHQYGNIANTVKSDDQRVRLPLGLLWFGGSSNMDVLPRHGHGPSPQVFGGRLFIQGMNSLSARDVYTGRVLWKREFEDLGTFNVYFDDTYADTPLSTAYNQVHLPGANARGSNYVVTPEGVYLVIGSRCLHLDAATGQTIGEFHLPADGTRKPEWGFVGVYGKLLLAGVGFGDFSERVGYEYTPASKRGMAWSPDRSASLGLSAFDRHTGRVLWNVDATHSFLHNAIVAGAGRIYCLDKLPSRVEGQIRRRGRELPDYRLVALDAATGQILWERTDITFGTWLGYSAEHDILLQAGAAASDRSPDETGKGMATFRGADGSLLWENANLSYAGPCMIHNDLIITNTRSYSPSQGAFRLNDGNPATITHPITGEPVAWTVMRTYGCNTAVASEHLLTFRSGAAGFYDLDGHGGTGNFGGFKSGCTSNLIVADGVLNAPDYTRTCTCAYQNQTSLALVHMPELDMWTYNTFTLKEPWRARHMGVNLGAPGNRRADDGVLWLEYPRAGGTSPEAPVEIGGDVTYFCHHSSRVSGSGHAWVAASGAEGIASLTVRLATEGRQDEQPAGKANGDATLYTVRLHFAEPNEAVQPGQRVFRVTVQGKTVLDRFDIRAEAGSARRSVVKEFFGIPVDGILAIELQPLSSASFKPVLCGVEAMQEATD